MEEQRKRVRSDNPVERLAAALLIPGEMARRLALLDNSQIAQLLDLEVCPNLSLLAPEATVCVEAADRLRGAILKVSDARRRRARTAEQGEHLLHAESALYHAGIPHLLLPFQRDRFASNTFMVPSLREAKDCLCRAGFQETPRSVALLLDRQTNRLIRLMEYRTVIQGDSSR